MLLTRIAMWSGPRNISTAMMRAWGNRSDTIVTDEPLYAHYLLKTGAPHPGGHVEPGRTEAQGLELLAEQVAHGAHAGQVQGAAVDARAALQQVDGAAGPGAHFGDDALLGRVELGGVGGKEGGENEGEGREELALHVASGKG